MVQIWLPGPHFCEWTVTGSWADLPSLCLSLQEWFPRCISWKTFNCKSQGIKLTVS
jgi:hypothetical protein